jgi:hypothetical protein
MSHGTMMSVLSVTLVMLCATGSDAMAFRFGCEPNCGVITGAGTTRSRLPYSGRAVLGDVGNGLRPGVSRKLKAPGPVYRKPKGLKILSARRG